MKICENCGKNNKISAKKCEFCGFLFESDNNALLNDEEAYGQAREGNTGSKAPNEISNESMLRTASDKMPEGITSDEAEGQLFENLANNSAQSLEFGQSDPDSDKSTSENSKIKIILSNLKYSLSFLPAIFINLAMIIVCAFAVMYFAGNLTSNSSDVVLSSILLLVFFSFFLAVFITGLILSTIFNIIRKKRFKK